jgi:hypothetical protein
MGTGRHRANEPAFPPSWALTPGPCLLAKTCTHVLTQEGKGGLETVAPAPTPCNNMMHAPCPHFHLTVSFPPGRTALSTWCVGPRHNTQGAHLCRSRRPQSRRLQGWRTTLAMLAGWCRLRHLSGTHGRRCSPHLDKADHPRRYQHNRHRQSLLSHISRLYSPHPRTLQRHQKCWWLKQIHCRRLGQRCRRRCWLHLNQTTRRRRLRPAAVCRRAWPQRTRRHRRQRLAHSSRAGPPR